MTAMDQSAEQPKYPGPHARARGCLLGGAIGDALGAPVEFLRREAIETRFGAAGITDYAPAWGGIGRITDDTQMTLFTAEGLLRAWVHGRLRGIASYTGQTAAAYQRWLVTQGEARASEPAVADGWLPSHEALHHRRAPGNTCLAALVDATRPGQPAVNDSKGCGGVMRIAPVGLFAARIGDRMSTGNAFDLACDLAGLTHGHPTGQLSAGVLAIVVREVALGAPLPAALATAKGCLRERAAHAETLAAIERAEALAANGMSSRDALVELGEGWIAEEALAIAIYCALVAPDFASGVLLAVNHDGDSDSTGAIAGNILGALMGEQALPEAWLRALELHDVIAQIASDLVDFRDWPISEYGEPTTETERIIARYPGGSGEATRGTV